MPWKQGGPVAPVRSHFTKKGKERRPDGTNIIENKHFIYHRAGEDAAQNNSNWHFTLLQTTDMLTILSVIYNISAVWVLSQ